MLFLYLDPSAPTEIIVTERGTDSLLFTWSHEGSCDFYIVQLSADIYPNQTAQVFDKEYHAANLPVAGYLYNLIVLAVIAYVPLKSEPAVALERTSRSHVLNDFLYVRVYFILKIAIDRQAIRVKP